MVDKIPPQALDMEAAVLGACLLEREAMSKVLAILIPESFYSNSNSLIFQAACDLYNTGKGVDILTVTEKLIERNQLDQVGGAYYVTGLTTDIASGAHAEHHAFIVAQKFIQREIIRLCTYAIQQAYEDTDVLEQLDQLTLNLIKVTANVTKNSSKHISGAAHENYLKIEKMSREPDRLLGHSTGFRELDRCLHGIQPGVIVIAARPSMGKSALMGQLVTGLATQGVSCQVFTLEVNASKFEMRMKTQLSGIHFERLQTGNIYENEWEKLSEVTTQISDLPIYIDDCATLSIVQLRSKCLQAYEKGVRCFALDYIQLADGGNDNEGLSEMSRAVKIISQELNVPFISLSQLSREVEKRNDKKPMLSDLRNSGSLEQDADVVLLLYRPEYYGLNAQDCHGNAVDNKGFAQVRIAKNKDGKVGTVDLTFKGENLTFSDYSQMSFNGVRAIAQPDDNVF